MVSMHKLPFLLLMAMWTFACNPPVNSSSSDNAVADTLSVSEPVNADSARPAEDGKIAPASDQIVPDFPMEYTYEGKKIRLHKVPMSEVDPELFGNEDFLDTQTTDRIRRVNGCIELQLDNGSTTQLCEIPEDSIPGEFREYDFWGSVKGTNFWLFHVYRYEDFETEVVNKKSGKHIATLLDIAVSPDKKHLMGYHPMDGHGWASIEMYNITGDDLALQWSIGMDDWGPESVYWAADGTVYILGLFGDESHDDRPEHCLRLEVEEGG